MHRRRAAAVPARRDEREDLRAARRRPDGNAANLPTKRELQFSKEATPDVPIALAARASASISIVFAPVAVAGGSMVDGGTCNNMPVNDLPALDSLSGASIVRVPAGYASSFDRHMPVATRQRLCGDG
ncbi:MULTISPECIES: patatin-like phospholipase family protein [Burkholderia]|uniref:patatin-like phospholipase family protein n=1 Tax=Burkholderia TaxID=32008 RepID=UPI000B4E2F96|nr:MULTISPECIES: patatin-like phospholipase family protein [Burkholderia]